MGSIEKTYANRRDNIVRKSAELSVLCDTNVGLLMFSPTGELTSYASKGRVEDAFLRYIENYDEIRDGDIREKEMLSQGLKHTKCEAEMLDIIEKIQALEEQLIKLDKRKIELQEKLRYYDPGVENISSVEEAELHEQLLRNAFQRVDDKIEALRKGDSSKNSAANRDKGLSVGTHHKTMAEGFVDSQANSNQDSFVNGSSSGQHSNHWGGERLQIPHGPHLNIGFVNSQTNWNL